MAEPSSVALKPPVRVAAHVAEPIENPAVQVAHIRHVTQHDIGRSGAFRDASSGIRTTGTCSRDGDARVADAELAHTVVKRELINVPTAIDRLHCRPLYAGDTRARRADRPVRHGPQPTDVAAGPAPATCSWSPAREWMLAPLRG